MILAALACAMVVTVAEPVVIPLLRRAAVLDVPSDRSSHTCPTPRGGGLPVTVGLLAAAALIGGAAAMTFAFTVTVFGLIGLVDDLRGLTAARRLAVQAAAAAVVAVVLVSGLTLPLPALAALAALAAVWLTGFVNAFNFMDGVNGISGAHAAVGGAAYAFLGGWRGDGFLLAAGAAVAAGGLAFLPWNAVRARVFLGDVGSYALGAALAVLAAYAILDRIPAEAALAPLALYLADTGWTLQRRIRAGEPWLQAHRTHVYQRWCDLGWSHQRVTAVTAAVTALLSLLGAGSLTGQPAVRAAADLAAAALVAAYLRSPALLRHRAVPVEAC
jgi:UDP-GlcNAc:undecaprenyl-phosphate/decaprenyl-phosphate GlcNAc-1-phosphate transferase